MEKVQRPLAAVMDAALKIVPDDCPMKADFIRGVGNIKDSIPYTAPEAMYWRWEDFIRLLNVFFGGIEKPWNDTLKDMIAAKIDYKEFLK